VLAVLGVGAMVSPMIAPEISQFDMYAMVLLSAALLPLLWTGLRLQRWEGGVLFLAYVAYVVVLWPKV